MNSNKYKIFYFFNQIYEIHPASATNSKNIWHEKKYKNVELACEYLTMFHSRLLFALNTIGFL